MIDFEALRVESYTVDQHLTDPGTVGPECAHQFLQYVRAPRALVWRKPSPEWQLFVVLLPLPERLGLIRNPIFGQLVRDWGHELRVLGVDQQQQVFDFRRLLDTPVLMQLLDALSSEHTVQALDVVFSMLATQMLTILEKRRPDWPQHLAQQQHLPLDSSPQTDSVFDYRLRTRPIFNALQLALRQQTIDVDLYSRALRSIDLRERRIEHALMDLVHAHLNHSVLRSIAQAPVSGHLAAYNWLMLSERHQAQRAYALSRLGAFTQIFCQSATIGQVNGLAQAIDSGQDRLIIQTLADVFAVDQNTIRALWRHGANLIGLPSGWRLQQLLLYLDVRAPEQWPQTDAQWRDLAQMSFDAS